jgi:hypothetical protein
VGNNTYYILQREGQKKRYGLSMYTKYGGKELSDHTKVLNLVCFGGGREIYLHMDT